MAESRSGNGKGSKTFTDEERAAMKERAREQKAAGRRRSRADGEDDVLAKITEMAEPDRDMAERIDGDKANLDDGAMWPNAYALIELTAAAEARISELVKRAVRPA